MFSCELPMIDFSLGLLSRDAQKGGILGFLQNSVKIKSKKWKPTTGISQLVDVETC